jgi:hypothetical protein
MLTPLLTLSLLLGAAPPADAKTVKIDRRAERACDGPAELRSALQDVGVFDDLKEPEKDREARTLEAYAALVEKYRTEPLAWRRYVEEQRRARRNDADALAADYAQRLRRKPGDRCSPSRTRSPSPTLIPPTRATSSRSS